MAIHHSDRAHATARHLRKSPTPAESVLWAQLRGKNVDGLRFRRQAPIGPYVVDFCCLSQRLVVEVDGGIHDFRTVEDAKRDAWLGEHGFRILRFPNAVVLGRMDKVLADIRQAIQVEHCVDTPHPSGFACHLPPQGGKDVRPEIWFYHLERSSLDQVLPELLDRTLKRGWRAVVRVADSRRLEEIDERLWTWRDDAFLAHGRADEPHTERQPIILTSGMENPNGAQALFIVDKSDLGGTEGLERCFILFDGRDDAALHGARERWRTLKAAEADLAYWKQTDEGWQRAA